MSRITKWKLEKTKVKVVFRLQFHATHIPQSGWDKLFISFIPADSGKATAKTTKANVRNGTCKWADPIYETTRLLQDIKTKQYDEKLFKLVMAMGSSRSSVLGEATINLADYADAFKPSVIALPLHGCDSGTILHVTVQLLTSKTGFREFEQQREIRERGLHSEQNSPEESSIGKVLYSEETINDQLDKVTRVRFKEKSKDLGSLEEQLGPPNEEYADSALGIDGSSNTSESLCAEKHDTSSTHEIDSLKSTVSGDLAGLSLSQSQLEKGDSSDNRFLAQGTNDWVHGWSSDYSVDNDLAAAYEENSRLRGCLEVAESSILELKSEVSSLQNHTDQLGCEAQKFAKQLATEIASGEELAKEVSLLKSESSKLRDNLERLKVSKLSIPFGSREATDAEQDHICLDLRLKWLKGILAIEDKIRELQNKACFEYHERDFRFPHADIEALLDALQNLKQQTGLAASNLNLVPSEGASQKEITEMSLHKNGQFALRTALDVDLYQPELGMLHCISIPDLVSHEPDSLAAANAMRGKIFELLRELDESKAEQESLAKKMVQMECYYEALVQELEEHQRQMLGELQNLRNEHSGCLYAVSSTKAEMETMRQDLNDQILRLADEKHNLDSLNKELARRVVTVEAALRRARLNYSVAVDQLQKDLELLSFQVLSMYETNENLIRQAFMESSQPSIQGHAQMAGSQKFDSRELHGAKPWQFQSQTVGLKKQLLSGDILFDELKRSLHLQEGLYGKVEEEVGEMHFVNIYLDVLSKTLQETLHEANDDIRHMQEKISELTQQLELSTGSKELLMQKLQNAMNDVHSLNEYKATCIARCNDMALQNEVLEANLQNVTCENHLLTEKIREWESLVMQYRSYENRYEACAAENMELTRLLENKTLENVNLQNEIFCLQEELKTVRTEFDELASVKKSMQNHVNSLQTKLQDLLASQKKWIHGLPLLSESSSQDLESRDLIGVMMQLEELQHDACKKILQLMEEKKGLVHERDVAQVSITAAESEIALMKQKFEHDLRNMVGKLDVANAIVRKLQLEIEAIAHRLTVSSEVEEKFAQQHNELVSDLDSLEIGLQEITSKNRDLVHEILTLESVSNELGMTKLTAAELTEENQALVLSLQDKSEEAAKLVSELNGLKESLLSLHYENQALMASSRDKVEESSKLASELNSLKDGLQSLQDENKALVASSQDKAEESGKLASELNSLKESLCSLQDENQVLVASLQHKTEEAAKLASELNSLKENVQFLHDENHALMASSQSKTEESAKLVLGLNRLKDSLRSLHDENQVLMASSQGKTEESAKLATELKSLQESLESLHDENQALTVSLQGKTKEAATLALELNCLNGSLQFLRTENRDLMACSLDKTEECARLALQLESLKETLQSMQDENQALMASSQDKADESAKLASELNTLKQSLQSLHDEKQAFLASSQDRTKEAAQLASEISSLKESLQSLHGENQALVVCSQDKSEESAQLASELASLRECLQSLHDENQSLMVSSRDKAEESAELASELNTLKECLQSLRDELRDERSMKNELESTISDLSSQLDVKQCQLMQFEQHESEMVHLKQLVSELESEKTRVCQLLLCYEECLISAREQSSSVFVLETQLSEMQELLIAADVGFIFTKIQYEDKVEALVQQLKSSDRHLAELHKKHIDVETAINRCLAMEAQYVEDNARLLTSLNSLRSELEASIAENRLILDTNGVMRAELEEFRNGSQNVGLSHCEDKSHHSLELERLRHMLLSSEEDIDNLISSKEELEVKILVLKAKLDEQQAQIISSTGYHDEQIMLQQQCNELTRRLSEQILKTEEFRNLSIHLKELKDKADAECTQAREKRDPEGPPVAMQESLRIAFIKEQYETRLQELKHHLSISKKHSEEMLWKLQDAIDEIENRKKSEASHLKKNEELGMKILELEVELQSVVSDKRERMKAYDLMKAEMECSLISLECCKEEKQKLEASLQECSEEKSKLLVELKLMKELVENSKSVINIHHERKDEASFRRSMHIGPWNGPSGDPSPKYLEGNNSQNFEEAECAWPAPLDKVDHSSALISVQPDQDVLLSSAVNGFQSSVVRNQESFLDSDMKHLVLINDCFRAESLKSSMDYLSYELERMKNDNSLLQYDHDFDSKFPGLQRELMQLQKANEELGSMFPLYNEFSGSGNALERVLALEIELAESLQAKNRSSIQFQSSFLKQHSDEEAVFKSFRDINELIKDMLELKGRYASVETELKEMHGRYSQLSLQFAEVEGERQKLMMTLKNVRASKKALHLNRSSSASLGDHSL